MNHSHQRDISVTVLVATSEAVGALPDACDAACHLLPPPLQPPEPRLGQRGTGPSMALGSSPSPQGSS